MNGLREVFAQRRWCAAIAVAAGCCVAAHARPARSPDPWQAALAARERFEAQPAHTRADYARQMDAFRDIYHGNPRDAHAAAAVGQVAELLAEQGRELHEDKSLRAAAGQYEFLATQYPASPLAAPALVAEAALYAPDALGDAGEVQRVVAELKKAYPGRARSLLAMGQPHRSATAGLSTASAKPPHTGEERPTGTPVSADSGLDDTVAKDAKAASPASGGAHTPSDLPRPSPAASSATGPIARVTGVRHWSTPTYTRVAIDLGDEVEYQAVRVEHPDRIFFDLHHARLAPELTGRSFGVTDDGFLTRIRAAQFSDDVTRVVLDVHEVTDYSAFLLPNPYRLIIDIHGKTSKAVNSDQPTANSKVAPELPPTPASEPPRVEAVAKPGSASAGSGLPPMPVTDGSAAFGLPPRKTAADAKSAAVAPPRVVIPVKPTASRPVPNTVVSKSNDNGTEVAAVSDQPGKVEATRHPTSAPISEKNKKQPAPTGNAPTGSGKAAPVDLGNRTAAAPALPAPPTADGETSLLRALGLKIGRIVIDAGHGGHDSGTLGSEGIQEKDVVLDVALRLGKLLHQRMGAQIVYTRADDTFIPLETRTAIANKAQADLFISVHANSSQDPGARGTEVYYLNFTSDPEAMRVASRENAVSTKSVHELSDLVKKIALKDKIDESRELAADVEESLYKGLEKGNDGLRDRGVKKAPFVVLIGANMPSILAEISFVTNPDDAAQLSTPEYRQRVAESLFNGVARYATGINGVKTPALQRAAIRK